jgi:hypothetical protein
MSERKTFALTAEERNSPLWQRLLAHFDERRDKLRIENDTRADEGDEHKTAARRGEIRALTALIRLNAPRLPEEG